MTLNNTLLLFPIQGPKDEAVWQTTLFLNFMEVEQGKRQGYILYILRLLFILHTSDKDQLISKCLFGVIVWIKIAIEYCLKISALKIFVASLFSSLLSSDTQIRVPSHKLCSMEFLIDFNLFSTIFNGKIEFSLFSINE